MRRFCVILLFLTVLAACSKPDKIDRLLSQMTLEEKCGQLICPIGFSLYGREDDSLWLSEDFIHRMDSMPLGSCWAVLRADPWSQKTVETGLHPGESARMLNKMQRYAVENTRLGIPLLFCEETPHGHMAVGTTVFPTGIGQASTWVLPLYPSCRAPGGWARHRSRDERGSDRLPDLQCCLSPRRGSRYR